MTREEKIAKMLEEWRGRGKVQLKDIYDKDGKFYLSIRENGKFATIPFDVKAERDAFIIEFGGKNHETVAADPVFLAITDEWSAETLRDMGHILKQIRFSGIQTELVDEYKVDIPEKCGYSFLPRKKSSISNGFVVKTIANRKEIRRKLRAFDDEQQAENFLRWLKKSFGNIKLYNEEMVTENTENSKNCKWKRGQAGDGSKRMELLLTHVDGIHYKEIPHYKVLEAAGDLAFAPCEKLSKKTTQILERTICKIAAEEGRVEV